MLYDYLKIFHILSAGLLLTGMAYSVQLWRAVPGNPSLVYRIQSCSVLCVFPVAVMQLITGFFMISLKHYSWSEVWIIGSASGLMMVVFSWFAFICFLAMSVSRRFQLALLMTCAASLFIMIFFMTSRWA